MSVSPFIGCPDRKLQDEPKTVVSVQRVWPEAQMVTSGRILRSSNMAAFQTRLPRVAMIQNVRMGLKNIRISS